MRRPVRTLIAGFTSAALLATLAACSSGDASPQAATDTSCKPSAGKVDLTYWTWIPDIGPIVDKFNETHPNIHVDVKTVVSSSAYQNLSNALKAESQPDLAMIEYQALPSFRLQNALTNVKSCESLSNLSSKVVPWTYSQVSFGTDDELYATPTDIAPLALYYRKDVLDKYGLSVPATWAEYEQLGKDLKAKDPSAKLTSFSAQDYGVLYGLMWQNGARPWQYSGDGFTFDMTSPEATKVADYWQGLLDDGVLDTQSPAFSQAQFKGFTDGSIVTSIGAAWQTGLMQTGAPKASGKWAVAPLPQWTAGGSFASGNYGGASTAVMTGTKHPYEAGVFADWLSTSPDVEPFFVKLGGLRALADDTNDAVGNAPQEYFGGATVFNTFLDAAKGIDPSFAWAPNQVSVNNAVSDALGDAISGSGTIADALGTAQTKAADDLRKQSVDVTVKQ